MDIKQIMRTLTEESPVWSQNKVAGEIGLTPQNMSQKMRSSDIRVGVAAAYLDVLGYELAVVPKRSRLPQGSIVVGEAE